MIDTLHPSAEVQPGFDTSFEIGLDITDEQFMAAACGAIQDIIALHNAPINEGGITNEEIFSRLRGVFDATSERFSADLARNVEAQMSVMAAVGHAACGNEELMLGFQKLGFVNEPVVNKEHKRHAKGAHEDDDDDEDD